MQYFWASIAVFMMILKEIQLDCDTGIWKKNNNIKEKIT